MISGKSRNKVSNIHECKEIHVNAIFLALVPLFPHYSPLHSVVSILYRSCDNRVCFHEI